MPSTPQPAPMPSRTATRPVLTIDLAALRANWRTLAGAAGGAEVSGVIKANGYGCGAEEVAVALLEEGCRTLFVSTLDEGLGLRAKTAFDEMRICILNGIEYGEEKEFKNRKLIPVLNKKDEAKHWLEKTADGPFAVHVDTGMNRLGMTPREAVELAGELKPTAPLEFLMSHLALADEPERSENKLQRRSFRDIAQSFQATHPDLPLSLANSAGIYLGESWCFDLVRPGIALYGGQPINGQTLPLKPVAHLHAPVIQLRKIREGASVGYGGDWAAERDSTIATVPLGYADGILRTASNRAEGFIGDTRIPLVGRISMDLVTFDVTDVPEDELAEGAMIELLGENISVDDLGRAAGSFGYEILTGLGSRYERRYVG